MNLLTDPLFRVETGRGLEHMSLPALLAKLGQNDVHRLVGIQEYQYDAFHVFLSYLAGAVLARKDGCGPVQGEEFWREGLLELAGNAGYDAWQLLSPDDSKPAFMQPPLVGEGRKATSFMCSPDELDLLLTAKNHDVKQARAGRAGVDTWLYALISLQTMSGFYGRGNHGISRMNGGYGNRSIVELVRDLKMGQRWLDAVARLLEYRSIIDESFDYDPEGLVLVWIEPWSGSNSLVLSDLDPFYIEICRQIRLQGRTHIEGAEFYPSQKPRIAAKELKGVVGDPWLPIDFRGMEEGKGAAPKALTFPPLGITVDHMRRLIFAEGLGLSPLQKPQPHWEGELWLSASVLVRGQGITDGFHTWKVRIPEEKSLSIFTKPSRRDALEKLSANAISYASSMQNRVLKPAVLSFVQGAPERIDFEDPFGNSAWTRVARCFESLWSADYFPWLFSVPESFGEKEELKAWVEILQKHALTVLEEAENGMANHSGRYYRTRTEVRRIFWGSFYKNFSLMRGEDSANSASS